VIADAYNLGYSNGGYRNDRIRRGSNNNDDWWRRLPFPN
jgi:hypothetical protein